MKWWQKIPVWWPIGVFLIMVAGAMAETRWALNNHLDREEISQAEENKLQWQAIAELNKHAYRAEEQLKFYQMRIETLERSR